MGRCCLAANAWGTDQLSFRADALEQIRRWTRREVDWRNLFRVRQLVHPRTKGKPTYRLVAQMTGEHGYRRTDNDAASSPTELEQALGPDKINWLINETGMSREELLTGLSRELPKTVDKLTPDGRIPSEQEASEMV